MFFLGAIRNFWFLDLQYLCKPNHAPFMNTQRNPVLFLNKRPFHFLVCRPTVAEGRDECLKHRIKKILSKLGIQVSGTEHEFITILLMQFK